MIQEGFQAQIKMILDKLSDAEDMLYRSSPYTEGKVQQTKINKETPSNGSMFELANLSDKVKGEGDDEPRVKAANPLPEKIQAVTDSSEACKHEQFSCNSTKGEDSVESEPTPIVLFQQTQQSFVQAQANFKHAHPNDTIDWHPFMSKSPIKGVTKQDQDCILIYESRTPIADREMASRLFLPSNFYNYTNREPCPGCIGCRGIPKRAADTIKQEVKDTKQVSTSATSEVFTSTATSHVFGQAEESTCVACNSLKPNDGETEPLSKHGEETATANVSAVDSVEPKTFQNLSKEASTSFFFQPPGGTGAPFNFTFRMTVSPGSPPQKPRSPLSHSPPTSPVRGDDDGPYFEPLIPLPDKVECRTGEEGQEVLFCDRCKLFRYDSDTSQWKERGVGDIKILLNPSSKRHRILMRREHVFKICANHVITSEMQLKPFPKSERAWLWTTLGDFSEETTTAETLAVRFKCNEVANNFKEVFDKALQTLSHKIDHWVSSSNAKDNHLDKAIVKKDQKERDVFGYEEEAFAQPGISARWVATRQLIIIIIIIIII